MEGFPSPSPRTPLSAHPFSSVIGSTHPRRPRDGAEILRANWHERSLQVLNFAIAPPGLSAPGSTGDVLGLRRIFCKDLAAGYNVMS